MLITKYIYFYEYYSILDLFHELIKQVGSLSRYYCIIIENSSSSFFDGL